MRPGIRCITRSIRTPWLAHPPTEDTVQAPRRFTRVVLALGLLAASAVVWTGCQGLFRPPNSSPELATIDASTQDPGLPGLPSDDPDATRQYLTSLRFVPVARISNITCDNGNAVRLQIYPEVRSHNLDPLQAALRGRIVARVVNGGGSYCDTLKLAPGETAYWWMGHYGPHPLTTVFWRIPPSGAVDSLAKTGPTFTFREARRLGPDARISDQLVHPMPRDDGDGGALAFAHNSTWIACLGACCESNGLVAVQ
jgi:hypothetical protein